MKILSISYTENLDKTKVKFSDDFAKSDWITKMDVLGDAIWLLNKHFETLTVMSHEERQSYSFDKEFIS